LPNKVLQQGHQGHHSRSWSNTPRAR
jgi:hypothetical protein